MAIHTRAARLHCHDWRHRVALPLPIFTKERLRNFVAYSPFTAREKVGV